MHGFISRPLPQLHLMNVVDTQWGSRGTRPSQCSPHSFLHLLSPSRVLCEGSNTGATQMAEPSPCSRASNGPHSRQGQPGLHLECWKLSICTAMIGVSGERMNPGKLRHPALRGNCLLKGPHSQMEKGPRSPRVVSWVGPQASLSL